MFTLQTLHHGTQEWQITFFKHVKIQQKENNLLIVRFQVLKVVLTLKFSRVFPGSVSHWFTHSPRPNHPFPILRWRQQVPICWYLSTKLQGVTSQKIIVSAYYLNVSMPSFSVSVIIIICMHWAFWSIPFPRFQFHPLFFFIYIFT